MATSLNPATMKMSVFFLSKAGISAVAAAAAAATAVVVAAVVDKQSKTFSDVMTTQKPSYDQAVSWYDCHC